MFSNNNNVYLQSHVSEQLDEVDWVADLFPESSSYLDVYNRFSLLGKRALYGHGIYFSESDIEIASSTDTTIIHCPTSNLFLGSGSFEYEKLRDDLSLTPRQDKIFELFYLKKKPIDVIADESNCCIMVINCELQIIRHKIIRVIDET